MKSGWNVNGKSLGSKGNYVLQILTIKGEVDFCGVAPTQDSFDDVFR
jgi:hypothetical protein